MDTSGESPYLYLSGMADESRAMLIAELAQSSDMIWERKSQPNVPLVQTLSTCPGTKGKTTNPQNNFIKMKAQTQRGKGKDPPAGKKAVVVPAAVGDSPRLLAEVADVDIEMK